MGSSNSLSSLTEGLDEQPYRESSPDDSHAPTSPMQRTFNGDVQAEASGKRARPDNTSRGIGPQSIAEDAKTIDVSSAELTSVSRDMSLSDLRLPFMHGGLGFYVLIGLGAIALVGSMLLLMTRSEEPASTNKVEASAPVAAPAPALVAEPAPTPAPAVAPAVPAEPVDVVAPVTPEKPRVTAKRRVRTKAKATTTKATTARVKAKKSRTRTLSTATR
jgi:hypothetical protein